MSGAGGGVVVVIVVVVVMVVVEVGSCGRWVVVGVLCPRKI